MARYGCVVYIGILCIYQCSAKFYKVSTEDQMKIYDSLFKKSQTWNRRDHLFIKSRNEDFQIQLVNITAEYRVKAMVHSEWSFKTMESNDKWNECITLYKSEIDRDEARYYEGENKCTKSVHSTTTHEMKADTQIEKEIKKWRKTYKYLKNLCRSEHLNDDDLARCLVDYIQRDQFDRVLIRLRSMKKEVRENIVSKQNRALVELENCLKNTFSFYLDKVRSLKNVLDICYTKINPATTSEGLI